MYGKIKQFIVKFQIVYLREKDSSVWGERFLGAGREWIEFVYVASECISEGMVCGDSTKAN